ncbi:MAG: malate synthase A, partial [Terriglobia bacterium]
GARMEDGRVVTKELARTFLEEEMGKVRRAIGDESFRAGRYELAVQIVERLITSPEFAPFLTIPAYEYLD